MSNILLALIVSSFAVGAVVLVGVLGVLLDRSVEPSEHKVKGKGA